VIPHITRVYIRNYKSIGQANVEVSPLCVFVGPNGAGKSNFIDALAFVHDSLSESIDLAFKNRGGIGVVRRRSGGHPTHIGFRLILELQDGLSADYAFEIAARPTERFSIAHERCIVSRLMSEEYRFELRNGEFSEKIPGIRPRVSPDRLALFAASATEEFRPVYDFLTSMRFYSITPLRVRELQDPDQGDYLKRDGSNAAAVLRRLREEDTDRYDRVCRLLSKVAEGIRKVEYRAIGQKETLQFKQDVGLKDPWTFDGLSMSDGTLRALGVLLAAYQPGIHSVIAIEEPEATVHPAVTELIVGVLMDATHQRQVLLTTHSPDILNQKDLKDTQIRIVTMQSGRTLISALSESSRDAIRRRLYTPGELLRSGELNPDLEQATKAAAQIDLFGAPVLKEAGQT